MNPRNRCTAPRHFAVWRFSHVASCCAWL